MALREEIMRTRMPARLLQDTALEGSVLQRAESPIGDGRFGTDCSHKRVHASTRVRNHAKIIRQIILDLANRQGEFQWSTESFRRRWIL